MTGRLDGASQPDARDRRSPAALPHHGLMERTFGEDFSGLEVSLGDTAALDAMDASAATDGSAVAFASTDPSPEEVAHELTHVVQRRRNGGDAGRAQSDPSAPAEQEADAVATRVALGQDAGPIQAPADARIHRHRRGATDHPGAPAEVARRYDAFLDGVYAAARRIVTANTQAVEAWRGHVLDQLGPAQMGAQVFATGFEQLQGQAAATGAEHLLAPYAAEPNRVRQELYENQMAGRWRACTGCHVSNQAWAEDARMRSDGDPGRTPAELLTGHAARSRAGAGGGIDLRLWTDPDAWDAAFGPRLSEPAPRGAEPSQPLGPVQPPQPFGPLGPVPTDPARAAPPSPAAPPRGASPEASLLAAREATAAIRPYLQPLGDAGYKILPSNVISRFGQAPPEELRAAVQAAFARRLDGYQQLMGKIDARGIDYLELDSLIAILKPMASPEVRALVDEDQRRRRVDEVVTIVGLLLVDLLSIVLPPVALVAGALHVAHGGEQASTGADRSRATGMHALVSPERQASGAMMQLAGALEVMGGAIQVGMAVGGLATATTGRIVAVHRRGDLTLQVFDSGVVRGTHAVYPGKSILMQRDGSFQALDELGTVVGQGVVGQGGGAAAAARAWGAPAGSAPAGGAGSGPAGATATSVSPTSTALTPVGPSPSQAPAPLGPAPFGPTVAAPSVSPWPAVSPFYTGGGGAGTFAPNAYNPCGRGDNCGFTSLSYAHSVQNPDAPIRTADDLYLQRLEQLGISVDENLSRQLVFPGSNLGTMRSRPGYDPLFQSDGGNRLPEYTVPSSALALGVHGSEATDVLQNWGFAFGRYRSIEDAVDGRLEFLEQNGGRCPPRAAVRQWVEMQRAELPGVYIVGSHSSAHYMTITIEANGRITGFDPQNLAQYPTLEAVLGRIGHNGFNLAFKVSSPPPRSAQ